MNDAFRGRHAVIDGALVPRLFYTDAEGASHAIENPMHGLPLGFRWGSEGRFAGRMTGQVILSQVLGHPVDKDALTRFCEDVIYELPDDQFDLSVRDVIAWIGENMLSRRGVQFEVVEHAEP